MMDRQIDSPIESLCGVWKVGRVHKRLPTAMLKILKSHAAVVKKTLTDMGRLAVDQRRPGTVSMI
jgi:hypothetical protein